MKKTAIPAGEPRDQGAKTTRKSEGRKVGRLDVTKEATGHGSRRNRWGSHLEGEGSNCKSKDVTPILLTGKTARNSGEHRRKGGAITQEEETP